MSKGPGLDEGRADTDYYNGSKVMMGSGLGFGIPGLGMVIFWGLILVLVVWLVRGVSGESRHQGGKSALDTLDERFARGEIGREEYKEKRKILS